MEINPSRSEPSLGLAIAPLIWGVGFSFGREKYFILNLPTSHYPIKQESSTLNLCPNTEKEQGRKHTSNH
jgi:hypothetical protein